MTNERTLLNDLSSATGANSTDLMWISVNDGMGGYVDKNIAVSNLFTNTSISGTYTPTLINDTNIDSSTSSACQYMRVGNTVTVSGRVNINPTATGIVILGISLPIISDFSDNNQLAGFAGSGISGGIQQFGNVIANTSVNRADLAFIATSSNDFVWWFGFTYRII